MFHGSVVECELPDEVQGDRPKKREVFRSEPGSSAGLILIERHLQNPVQLIFEAPVPADEQVEPLGLGPSAADVVASLFSLEDSLTVSRMKVKKG